MHRPLGHPHRGISTLPIHLLPYRSLSTELLLRSLPNRRFTSFIFTNRMEFCHPPPFGCLPILIEHFYFPIAIQEIHMVQIHPHRLFAMAKWRYPFAPHKCAIDAQIPEFRPYPFPTPILCSSFSSTQSIIVDPFMGPFHPSRDNKSDVSHTLGPISPMAHSSELSPYSQ